MFHLISGWILFGSSEQDASSKFLIRLFYSSSTCLCYAPLALPTSDYSTANKHVFVLFTTYKANSISEALLNQHICTTIWSLFGTACLKLQTLPRTSQTVHLQVRGLIIRCHLRFRHEPHGLVPRCVFWLTLAEAPFCIVWFQKILLEVWEVVLS